MPPDLVAETTRPVAVLSSVSQGPPDTNTSTTPTNCYDAEGGPHTLTPASSTQGGLAGGEARLSEGTSPTTTTTTTLPANLYLLTPALRAAFEPVGATDQVYTFREVLILLKKYLFSNTHLFDTKDKLYVNCGGDTLGTALGVDRFHYNQVKYVISRNLILCHGSVTSVPDTVNPAGAQTAAGSPPTVVDPAGERPPNVTRVNRVNITNDSTDLAILNCMPAPQGLNNLPQYSVVPGPSRVGHSARISKLPGQAFEITVPDVPDIISDVESVYSYQGYETAYCRNTEFETSDEEEVVEVESETFEEYEVASDDAKEEDHSDDSDSMIEDVEVAVLAYALIQEVSGEEADDSDTDDQSGEDPELVGELWDCLTCGLKNKPFVRYCSKCWQLRKNWLPDRPKRRKRKPRPKRRHQRLRTDSVRSDNQSCERNTTIQPPAQATFHSSISRSDNCLELEELPKTTSNASRHQRLRTDSVRSDNQSCERNTTIQPPAQATFHSSISKSDSCLELEQLPRTSSNASTVSLRSASPERMYQHYSQDSGISSSQDFIEEINMELPAGSNVVDVQGVDEEMQVSVNIVTKAGTSSGSQAKQSEATTSADPSNSSKKRRSSSLEEGKSRKRSKTGEDLEKAQSPSGTLSDSMAKELNQLLQSASNEWLNSSETKALLSLPSIKAISSRVTKGSSSIGCSVDELDPSQVCSLCCLRPKNASIIHGRLSHQATCYHCARRLLRAGARCPVCRRKIHMVTKNIVA